MTNRPILNRVAANRPVLLGAATLALDAIEAIRRRRQAAGEPDGPVTADELADAFGRDPVATNELSAERLRNSRTAVGGGIGLFGFVALAGQIIAAVSSGDPMAIDADLIGGAVLTLIGAVVTLVGRIKSGLAPIDWKRPWTLLGIGR